jgi:hypothetical protein
MLSKNVPLVALLVTTWLLQRAGWTTRAEWLLRAGMAVIWLTEGLFPKILFQQQTELDIVAALNPLPINAGGLLVFVGVCQILSAFAVLMLRGRILSIVLARCRHRRRPGSPPHQVTPRPHRHFVSHRVNGTAVGSKQVSIRRPPGGAKGELRVGQIYPKTSRGRFQSFLYAVIPTGKPSKQTTGSRMNKLTRVDVSEQELEVFLNVADRLGIGVRDLLEKDVPFREMELAGHELGRAIAPKPARSCGGDKRARSVCGSQTDS